MSATRRTIDPKAPAAPVTLADLNRPTAQWSLTSQTGNKTRDEVGLDPATAPALVTDAGPPGEEEAPGVATTDSAAARLCVDSGGRPVEAVVTVGGRVVTSVFSQWGLALEAMPPPDGLLDRQDG